MNNSLIYEPKIGGYNLFKHFIGKPNCCLYLEILLEKVRAQIKQ